MVIDSRAKSVGKAFDDWKTRRRSLKLGAIADAALVLFFSKLLLGLPFPPGKESAAKFGTGRNFIDHGLFGGHTSAGTVA